MKEQATENYKLAHYPANCDCTSNINDPSQARIGIHPYPDRLHVVTMLSNPLRWRARYANYQKFAKGVQDAGAILYTCEVAFGGRHFEITSPDNPNHLQLRTSHELWHKENALNLMIQRLPASANKVAWIDADIQFARPDWAQETLHLLDHYDFIQMFSQAHDLNYENETSAVHSSFMAEYQKLLADPLSDSKIVPNQDYSSSGRGLSSYWHPGFAWAARKASLAKVGMLMDWPILGSADWHMAWGLIGQMHTHLVPALSDNYKNWCMEWQNRAEQHIKRNIGVMPGTILHSFHGDKKLRSYGDRWKFLIDAKFDPAVDILKDHQGLWQLSGNNQKLRDGIRAYSKMRNEDSTEV